MAATAAGLNHLISFPKKVQVHFGQDINKVNLPTDFFSKNLGSVYYPKDSFKSFGRSLVTLDFAQKIKNKIVGGFYEKKS